MNESCCGWKTIAFAIDSQIEQNLNFPCTYFQNVCTIKRINKKIKDIRNFTLNIADNKLLQAKSKN